MNSRKFWVSSSFFQREGICIRVSCGASEISYVCGFCQQAGAMCCLPGCLAACLPSRPHYPPSLAGSPIWPCAAQAMGEEMIIAAKQKAT